MLGAPLPAVLGGVYYATVASLLSAAMKLLRLGQNASQSLLTETLAEAPAVITAAEQVPVAAIGWFNPHGWISRPRAHATADSQDVYFLRFSTANLRPNFRYMILSTIRP